MNDPGDPSLEVLILLLSKIPLTGTDHLLDQMIDLARRYVEERFSPEPLRKEDVN